MSTGDEFFALLAERLPAAQVQGWLARDGEELYRAIARVFETASERSVAEIRAARALLATFATKATGTITVTWDEATTLPYTVPAGTIVARTAWGVEYVLTEPIVRTAGQEAGSAEYAVEARWAGFEANVDAGFVDWNVEGLPQSFEYEPEVSAAFYRSDGASGSYADASTNVAARTIFAGAGVPTGTVVLWARNTTADIMAIGDAADSLPALYATTAGEFDAGLNDASAGVASSYAIADPSGASWHAFVVTIDGTDLEVWGDGVSDNGPLAAAGTYAASDALALFASFPTGAGTNGGDIRAFAIFSRALSSTEIADLYAAGPSHDLTVATGAYTPDPVVLWDQPDVAGVVANRGSGGTCNLVFHGGVTSETL